jgi:hypothetical protein
MTVWLTIGLSFLFMIVTQGQSTNAAAPPPSTSTSAVANLKEISPGIFEYNGIRLDKKNHRIIFPATVNQRQGLIEYLLVNEKGKVHESLFSTKILPRDIHVALLLIGLKDDPKANSMDRVPPSAIDMAYLETAPKLQGPPVRLSVAWTQDGIRKEVPAEDWVFNLQTKHPMTQGPWTYNGSIVENGVFVAEQECSIVAVITDPTALVNNPREGYDNDEIWQLQENVIPPLDTPVELTITLAESTAAKP